MLNLDITLQQIRDEQFKSLNDLQFKIFKDVIIKFNEDLPHQIHLIRGSAGTGKTYSVNKAIEYIISEYDISDKMVSVTAPTNQAVNNVYGLLSDDARELAPTRKYLSYKTLHSLLGYEEVIDGYGNLTFKPATEKQFVVEERLSKLRILIIDEASMIPKQIYDILIKNFLKYKFHIFFIGDPFQLPPINEDSSLVFNDKEISRLSRLHIQTILTEIIRQRQGHPILDITKQYTHKDDESYVDLLSLLKAAKTTLYESVGVININNNNKLEDDINKMINILTEYYAAEQYKHDSKYIKIVAYTNDCVDLFNDIIRSIIYPDQCNNKLVIGERLILNSPVKIGKSKKFLPVNQEVIITEFTPHVLDINVGSLKFTLKYYDATIEYETLFATEYTKMKIIHESSQAQFESKLSQLKKVAEKYKPGSFNARKSWVDYYTLKHKFFTDVKYGYCVTTHKAQGSTYENIILILNDLNKCRKPEERNKLTYTAMTRAKNNLILINS